MMKNVGLVLEGGGQRGRIYSRSAGLYDGQKAEAAVYHRCFRRRVQCCRLCIMAAVQNKALHDRRPEKYHMYSAGNIVKTGWYIDMDLIFDQFPSKIYPFDLRHILIRTQGVC